MYLLDTNVMSELRKGTRCDPNVLRWWDDVQLEDTFLSALWIGEARKGIELLRSRDRPQANALEAWLQEVMLEFEGRFLPVDGEVADRWGRMYAIYNIAPIDGLMAATAIVHDMIFVTRNVRHVQGLGVDVLNPFLP